jgi:hypothetical protein
MILSAEARPVYTATSLARLGVAELRACYLELFGEGSHSSNRTWLVRRVLWKQQALEQGGLSERAKARARELAAGSELRQTAPLSTTSPGITSPAPPSLRDPRLPPVGTVLRRKYRGREEQVQVLADGFVWQGVAYATLSALAKAMCGSHCNGYRFFGLDSRGAA